jgi:drug/metabolite transporter (DMT)-like permease/cation transporter-like permease
VAAPDDATVADVMRAEVVTLPSSADREEVSRITSDYDLVAVPVVDGFGRMVALNTFFYYTHAIVEEQTEDVQRLGAVQPLEEPYFVAGFWAVAQKRVGWLVVLFIGEMFTGSAMRAFEDTLAQAVSLTLFIPLIISSGGNSGSQSATLITRALAVGDVEIRDALRVLTRELGQGLVLGACLGVIGFVRTLTWGFGAPLAGVVALSLLLVVPVGTLVGAMLPLLLRRLGFDPAVASAPFVASLVDVTGIVNLLQRRTPAAATRVTPGTRAWAAGTATLGLVGAALGFATIPIFTTLATRAGTPLVFALAGRYAIASLALAIVAGGFTALRMSPARGAQLAALGGGAQAFIAFLSLSALRYIPASTLVFLFYTFPVWVAILAAVRRTEQLTAVRLLALGLSSAGVVAMVGLPGADAVHPVGAALALVSAVAYALFIPWVNRLQTGLSATVATAWVVIGAALIFLAATAATRTFPAGLPAMSGWSIAGLGIVSTAVPFVLFLRGLATLSPVRTAIITTVEPFFVTLLAALVLGQPVRAATVAGGSLIASAVLLLQVAGRARS